MHKCMTDNLSIEPTEIKILIEFHYSSQRKFILNQRIFLKRKKKQILLFDLDWYSEVSGVDHIATTKMNATIFSHTQRKKSKPITQWYRQH